MIASQNGFQGFSDDLREHPDSLDLVNDLMTAKQNAWQTFQDYLLEHPNSFSGKIYNQLLDQKKDQTKEQIVQKTFIEAKKRSNKILRFFLKFKDIFLFRLFQFKD